MNYALEKAKKQAENVFYESIKDYFKIDKNLIITNEIPLPNKFGISIPTFRIFGKGKKVNEDEIRKKIIDSIELKNTFFNKIKFENGYLNFYFDVKKLNNEIFADFKKMQEQYGQSEIGKNQTIVIDYSAPNIAKPFSVGHLRSTIIGQALYNILKSQGYKVIGDNHIGDWGTQFGKLLCAYHLWGDRSKIEQNPIKELLNLYIKFHKEADIEPILNDEARNWFKRLEDGDKEARDLWCWITDISLAEFDRVYGILGVKIDQTLGESFYEDKMSKILEELQNKNIVEWIPALDKDGKEISNEKLLAIDLKPENIKLPLLLKKSDGTTLYATRDLATAKYRVDKWDPDKIIYVVGAEQTLYFRQLFTACKMFGLDNKFIHLPFGLVRLPEGKMSTRLGRVILLEDVLDEAVARVKKILANRDWSEYDKEKIAKIVGIGAIKYADLAQDKKHDIIFDWDRILNLKGNSGPYLQYQYVRMQSILKKAAFDKNAPVKPELLEKDEEIRLLQLIMRYQEILGNIAKNYEIHNLANYLYELATEFSRFYENVPVLRSSNLELQITRLYLCFICSQILKSGLNLLGINVPEKM